MAKKYIKKGAKIQTTGKGKTEFWRPTKGTVIKRRGDRVIVHWDKTPSHYSDNVRLSEIKALPKSGKVSKHSKPKNAPKRNRYDILAKWVYGKNYTKLSKERKTKIRTLWNEGESIWR